MFAFSKPAPRAKPVLYLLDEFPAIGNLEPVERAMGLMAGYGVQLWPILQDVHQLRATYGQRAGTFLSNAGVLQANSVCAPGKRRPVRGSASASRHRRSKG